MISAPNNNKAEHEFIELHRNDDVRKLALTIAGRTEIDREYVLTQIAGYQATTKKIPSWSNSSLIFPAHLSMEQCSSEATAGYKASLCSGSSLTDLTGGFGVDFAFMSSAFNQSTYVEQQEVLCNIANHNFNELKINNFSAINSNANDHLETMEPQSWIYIDPARRNEKGGKTVLLEDCQPDITKIYGLLISKCDNLMVKLSPMLDISLALKGMPKTKEIHVISVDNECKELLFISDNSADKPIIVRCVNLNSSKREQIFVFNRDDEQNAQCNYASSPQKYLYEPNSSVMKAGAFKLVATHFGIAKLHPQSHLYTSEKIIDDFPGRAFEVLTVHTSSKNDIKELKKLSPTANITIRNYPSSVNELRKKLNIKEGGNDYLFATTLNDNKKVIIRCRKTL